MKKIYLKICGIIGFCIFFPTFFTLFINGRTELKNYTAADSGRTIIIKENDQTYNMDIEEFIPCVLAGLFDIDTPIETIKAGSVIIRTYIISVMGYNDTINAGELNLNYILYDRLKDITEKDFEKYYSILKEATLSTYGEKIRYQGNIITPYYHGISAGKTRNGKDALNSEDFPYLVSKESKDDLSAPEYTTITYFSYDEFCNLLTQFNSDIVLEKANPLKNIQVTRRCQAGYVSTMQIGNITLTGDEFQKCFSLNSPYFELEEYEDGMRIICKGNGHGLGLSLYGAKKMADSGKTYKEILTYYFTDVTIEK